MVYLDRRIKLKMLCIVYQRTTLQVSLPCVIRRLGVIETVSVCKMRLEIIAYLI